MKHYILLPLLAVLSFISSCQQKVNENIDGIACSEISSEISNQAITCFGEDRFGYIWIGTARGLNRYNGVNYHQYFNINTKKSECNRIQVIFKDSRQQLWVGTKNGILRYNEQDYFENIPIVGNDFDVIQIFEDRDGGIYFNTSKHLLQYIPESNKFIPRLKLKIGFAFGIVNPSHLCFVDSLNRIWVVGPSIINCYKAGSLGLILSYKRNRMTHYYYSFLDRFGILWFTSGKKLELFDTRYRKLQPLPESIDKHPVLSKALISLIQPYRHNSLLINTNKNGLFLYDRTKNKVIQQSENEFPFLLPSIDITTIFKDSRKNLWIGSVDQGYTVIYNYSRIFNINLELSNATKQESVIAVSSDKSHNYWIATQSNKLIIYNSKSRNKTIVDLHSFFSEDPYFQDKIISIIHDEDYTWFLTSGAKILKCIYNNNKLIRIKTYNIQAKSYEIIEDINKTIWIASTTGVYIIKKNATSVEKVVSFPDKISIKCKITLLATGEIFACLSNKKFYIINPDKKHIKVVDLSKIVGGNQFTPNDLYTDLEGNVWTGTADNGLYLYKVKTRQIIKIEGLFCNDIYSLTQDSEGKIWAGTSQGLYKVDMKTFKSVGLYKSDGIGGNQFNEGAALTLNNTLIFGGTHGLTMFNPKDIVTSKKVSLLFEDLFVNNQIVKSGKNSCIERSLAYNPKINLKYDQNFVNISFTAIDYREYPRIRYSYKLEGYDNNWIDSHETKSANYSKLPAGDYKFKVRITNLDNAIILTKNDISIHIARAPWASIPAILLYSLLVMGLVWYIIHLYTTTKINQTKAILANREREHEVYVNKMNQNFFTNISHEFRTPLTMISGPVSTLYKDNEISSENRELLGVIHQGVERMLRLVNQVLKFNQLDNDALRLNVAPVDIAQELIRLTDFFKSSAKLKGVHFKTYGLDTPCTLLLDKDKFEDVIMNLLSNALKFTVTGNTINLWFEIISSEHLISLFQLEEKIFGYDYIKISVEDDGIGIPDDKLEVVFQRFTQLNETSRFSTGIGLYYVRRLIELHHGYIKAEKGRKKGACLSFILPLSAKAYSSSEILLVNTIEDKLPINKAEITTIKPKEYPSCGKYTILIVDDDLEILNYLKIILKGNYKIISKNDAESAILAIENEVPDLILSDVLMPGMDGFLFCKRIKENDAYSHIPFILLTAKSMVNDQVEGLEIGANAYVTKPFEPAYLLALVKSQLRNRDLVRNTLGNTTNADDISEDTLSPRDKIFMTALYELMEKELSSVDLNINRMIDVFKIGRTKFFNKVKGLTGETPNTFFKTYKLNRAAELIIKGEYNLSEIAYMTGFNTLSYFSVSFKKHFGVTPSEYNGKKG